MKIIRDLHSLPERERTCVATIGNFDGVHLGHQAMLRRLGEKAEALGLPALVILFEPQPQEYFAPDKAPARLTRLRDKIQALHRLGVDRVLCLRFRPALAALSAEAFIEQYLVRNLWVRYLIVGDDFRFGKNRTGDYALLDRAGREHGFTVVSMPTVDAGGERVSSTRIRQALAEADFTTAARMLGRPFAISGRIGHGDKRGRSIGFPTANIQLRRRSVPVSGVFAVEVAGIRDVPLAGVANVGTRPTVDGTRSLLEFHLFDFDADIYGKHVDVTFRYKLRDERRFASLDELKTQIGRDVEQGRAFFRANQYS
jgi:riboflavin kinase/FMN adenylyltransferase